MRKSWMQDVGVIAFARSTSGDGFYVWNRDEGLDGQNVNLYHFMHIVLADNAIARSNVDVQSGTEAARVRFMSAVATNFTRPKA